MHTQQPISINDFKSFIQFLPDPVLITNDHVNQIIRVNQAFEEYSGIKEDELVKTAFKDLMETSSLNSGQLFLYSKDHKLTPIVMKGQSVKTNSGDVIKVFQIHGEGETFQTQKLQESEQRYRSLFEHNIDAVLTFDLEGRFTYVNQATEQLMGYSSDELLGQPFLPHIVPERQEYTINEFNKVKEGNAIQYETSMYNKQGSIVELHVTVIPIIVNGEFTGVHCIGKDITDKKYFEKKLNEMAFQDYLTKLPNQYYFQDYLEYLIHKAEKDDKRFSILFLDLDRFKSVNDSLGHEFGDLLLRTTANRLLQHLPKEARVFRHGGDEFIITLKHKGCMDASKLATDIINLFNKPLCLEGIEVTTTTSIGISEYPIDGQNAKLLIRNADNAMYQAKNSGKNQYKLYQSINNNDETFYRIEPLLKNAIEQDELSLVYQPQVSMKDNTIKGFEALLRWNNKELGNVPPNEFIPIAEESDLIVEIGQWVIETACNQISGWNDAGFKNCSVSVNVSIRQLYNEDFVYKLKETLRKTNVAPECLVIEVTESVASNAEAVNRILHQIKELGVKISIDDFGTGYSSLKYPKNFPMDYLKIDQSFVFDLFDDQKDQDIVSTIISLGHKLNLVTIAEGVETIEQLEFLREHQCDIGQGYYYSKPMVSDECIKWLTK